jgi:hypothetical protein
MNPGAAQEALFAPEIDTRPECELLSDAYDAAAILAMGDEGIAGHTVDRLRRDLLAAVAELGRRWTAP